MKEKLFFNKKSVIRKFIGLSIVLMLGIPFSYGQREKNNIYLFDCTGSMKSNQLWEPAKSALEATITAQTTIPGSQFCVIPFGDEPYRFIDFNSDQYDYKKSDIEESFNKYILQAKYTHISDVLNAGFNKVDPNKENKIYLLTDGMPNGGDSPQKVAETIMVWCGNHRNCRLFYVALIDGVVNPVIQQAIDACPDAFIVQCEGKVIPQIADISSDIYTNIEELASPKVASFSIPGTYDLCVSADDQLFNVNVLENSARDGKVLISLSAKDGLDISGLHNILQGSEYSFPINLQCVDKRYFIANPIITVHVSDEVPSKLTLATGLDELQAESVEWYDKFLWNDALPDKKIEWDLEPEFKNELLNSKISLRFEAGEGHTNDFKAWYNGDPIVPGNIIQIEPKQPALLEVQFNHDAVSGKRYFKLVPDEIECIDIINEQSTSKYDGTSLRTEYNVGWNPIKILLLWVVVILLVLLLLWLVVLKHIFYPVIKMSKVTIAGPGTYYVSKKIKGARKVVITSKHKNQNIFSRIFTGEIKFIKSEFFTSDIYIIPAGGKKKVKIKPAIQSSVNVWDIYPSSIFGQYDKGTIASRKTSEKTEIEFS